MNNRPTCHNCRNAEQIRRALEAGANPNERGEGGMTPLFSAPDAESVALLLGAGADIHRRDDRGRTPLFTVRNWKAIRELLLAGLSLRTTDTGGRRASDLWPVNRPDIFAMA